MWCGCGLHGRDSQSGTTHPIPRSMHHTPAPRCCTHMHAAQPKATIALSPPCPTTPQRPVSRLTIPSHPICELCCRVARHNSSSSAVAGGLPMPCWRASHQPSKTECIRSRCSQSRLGPKALAGAISRQRARIIPTVGINAANSAMPMHGSASQSQHGGGPGDGWVDGAR